LLHTFRRVVSRRTPASGGHGWSAQVTQCLSSHKNQATPTAHIHFNYAAHGAKISVIESLLGQSGTLKLQRFSIEALERNKDHLLFAAETDGGKVLPAETAQKLMQLPASQCQQQNVLPGMQIENALTAAHNDHY